MFKTPLAPDRGEGGFLLDVENAGGLEEAEKIADDLRFCGW